MEDIPTIVAAVREYILAEFLPGEPPESLAYDTPLISGGILDSIATLKVVLFLEERFGIVLNAYEVDREKLDTLDRITNLLASKR